MEKLSKAEHEYDLRVRELQARGFTRGDAQGVVDCQDMQERAPPPRWNNMNTINGPSFSSAELFRANGTLPADRIEALIDAETLLQGARDVSGALDDAMASYPNEDFLTDAIRRFKELAHGMKGQRKADMLAAILALEDIEKATQQSAEYGMEELKKAQRALEAV